MNKKPLIGVCALVDEERESLWMLPGYFDGVTEAGGIPVMLPLTSNKEDLEQLRDTFDGFIFSGGPDVTPKYYNMKDEVGNVKSCLPRDEMEIEFARIVIEMDKPILGICRGLQLINVALGGTLWQDLPAERNSEIKHSQERPYDKPSHSVRLEEDGSLYRLFKKETLDVNSCHHQGIRELAPGLRVMAKAEDGLIEAFEEPSKDFLWAVQWHPEFMHKVDLSSKSIFKEFVEKCK